MALRRAPWSKECSQLGRGQRSFTSASWRSETFTLSIFAMHRLQMLLKCSHVFSYSLKKLVLDFVVAHIEHSCVREGAILTQLKSYMVVVVCYIHALFVPMRVVSRKGGSDEEQVTGPRVGRKMDSANKALADCAFGERAVAPLSRRGVWVRLLQKRIEPVCSISKSQRAKVLWIELFSKQRLERSKEARYLHNRYRHSDCNSSSNPKGESMRYQSGVRQYIIYSWYSKHIYVMWSPQKEGKIAIS